MFSLFTFSLRNVFRKKTVAVLAILGVALGCALMTFILAISEGVSKRVENTFSELTSCIIVSPKDSFFGGLYFGGGTPLPKSYINEIKTLPHVKSVYAQLCTTIRSQVFREDLNIILPLIGYDTEEINLRYLPLQNITEGRKPAAENEVTIGKRLKESLNFLNIEVKEEQIYHLVIPGINKPLEIKVVGTFETGSEITDAVFYGQASLVRKIARLPEDKVSTINVVIDRIDRIETVAQAIDKLLKDKGPPVQVVVPRNMLNPLSETLKVFNGFLYAIATMAALAGGFSILIIMLISVMERKKEFGILKAVGWKSSNIIFVVMVESLILSLIGAGLGVLLGYGGVILAHNFILGDILTLNWPVFVMVCLFGVLIGTLGGIYPAWRANKVNPAEILRHG